MGVTLSLGEKVDDPVERLLIRGAAIWDVSVSLDDGNEDDEGYDALVDARELGIRV